MQILQVNDRKRKEDRLFNNDKYDNYLYRLRVVFHRAGAFHGTPQVCIVFKCLSVIYF